MPHDVHDWDSNQILMLADIELGGHERKVIVNANCSAFYYLVWPSLQGVVATRTA